MHFLYIINIDCIVHPFTLWQVLCKYGDDHVSAPRDASENVEDDEDGDVSASSDVSENVNDDEGDHVYPEVDHFEILCLDHLPDPNI